MATLEEIMAALNAGGSASNMSSSDLATLMSGGGAMSSGAGSPYTDYGGTNAWTDPNSPEFKSRMDTLTNTMLSGQRNQVEDYVRRAALSGVQRGGYNVAGAPNYAGGLQREAINALAGGYDTRYTNALNYLMNAGTLNEKGIERSFTAEQNSKQQAATAALQKAGFDQQTAERIAGEAFTGGENTKARDLQVTLQKAGFDQQTAERLAGEVFTAAENKAQQGWQSGENALGRALTTSERLGAQAFTAGENATQRGWQSGENATGRAFTAGENATQRGWQSGENTAQRGWQSGENTNQRDWTSGENVLNREATAKLQTGQQNWQSGENVLNRALTTSEGGLNRAASTGNAALDRAIAQQNANTSATGSAGNLANQTAAQKLAQDKFDLEKQVLAGGGSGGGSGGGGIKSLDPWAKSPVDGTDAYSGPSNQSAQDQAYRNLIAMGYETDGWNWWKKGGTSDPAYRPPSEGGDSWSNTPRDFTQEEEDAWNKGIYQGDNSPPAGYMMQQLTPYDPTVAERPEGFRETWGYVNAAGDVWNQGFDPGLMGYTQPSNNNSWDSYW